MAWDTTIREAQAVVNERRREEATEEARKAAEVEAESGRKLGEALSHLGIEADPAKNWWRIDDLEFFLSEHQFDKNVEFSHFKYRSGGEGVAFTLIVVATYPVPQEGEDEYNAWIDGSKNTNGITVNNPICGDWTNAQAELATAIDEARAGRKDMLAERTLRKERRAAEASYGEYPRRMSGISRDSQEAR